MQENIFKAYDIRGIYPQDLNEELAFKIGRAFAIHTKRNKGELEVVVGSDMRVSSPQLKEHFIKGVLSEGLDVVDIGLVPIDAVYFAINKLGFKAGVMVTASHNPKEYNGFKMFWQNLEVIRGKDLLAVVKDLPETEARGSGSLQERDIMSEYIQHLLSFVEIDRIKPLRVVVDAGNGMAGKVVPLLERSLPIEVVPLFFDLDGNFPNHPSNPLEPKSKEKIAEMVVAEQADFGIIFDGDTDRLFLYDEKGNFIRADITLLLLAREFLQEEPGATFVYNVICSKIVPEKIAEWGGRAVVSKVGFVNVAEKARQVKAVMGGELSGHYCFRDNGYGDSGFIAFLKILQLLSHSSERVSELIQPFLKYAKGDEVNIRVDDISGALEKVKKHFADGRQSFLDGVTVEYGNWWVNVRPSNTEPLLRITVEAENQNLLQQKTEEVLAVIKEDRS